MSVAHPEVETPVDWLADLDEEWEIPCDIYSLRIDDPDYPRCKGEPARWIGWRPTACCGKSPRYRLVCNFCKKVYQRWAAMQAYIACPVCGQDIEGFCEFVPLRKS